MNDIKELVGKSIDILNSSECDKYFDKDCQSIVLCGTKLDFDTPESYMNKWSNSKAAFILDDGKVILDAKIVII